MRIAGRQYQQAPFRRAPKEHEAVMRVAFCGPTLTSKPLDGGPHGAGQIRRGLEALTLDHLPLQIPEDEVARRGGMVECGEGVAAHAADCRGDCEVGPFSSRYPCTLYELWGACDRGIANPMVR